MISVPFHSNSFISTVIASKHTHPCRSLSGDSHDDPVPARAQGPMLSGGHLSLSQWACRSWPTVSCPVNSLSLHQLLSENIIGQDINWQSWCHPYCVPVCSSQEQATTLSMLLPAAPVLFPPCSHVIAVNLSVQSSSDMGGYALSHTGWTMEVFLSNFYPHFSNYDPSHPFFKHL